MTTYKTDLGHPQTARMTAEASATQQTPAVPCPPCFDTIHRVSADGDQRSPTDGELLQAILFLRTPANNDLPCSAMLFSSDVPPEWQPRKVRWPERFERAVYEFLQSPSARRRYAKFGCRLRSVVLAVPRKFLRILPRSGKDSRSCETLSLAARTEDSQPTVRAAALISYTIPKIASQCLHRPRGVGACASPYHTEA